MTPDLLLGGSHNIEEAMSSAVGGTLGRFKACLVAMFGQVAPCSCRRCRASFFEQTSRGNDRELCMGPFGNCFVLPGAFNSQCSTCLYEGRPRGSCEWERNVARLFMEGDGQSIVSALTMGKRMARPSDLLGGRRVIEATNEASLWEGFTEDTEVQDVVKGLEQWRASGVGVKMMESDDG